MENVRIRIDSAEFDRLVHGVPGGMPVLAEGGDLLFVVKPNATTGGKAGVVLSFTVTLPDGIKARAQAVITANLLETAGAAVKGWREGGHIR